MDLFFVQYSCYTRSVGEWVPGRGGIITHTSVKYASTWGGMGCGGGGEGGGYDALL